MQTIYLEASRYATAQDLHRGLARMLFLPAYYGLNADALNDCLGERNAPLTVWVAEKGEGEVAECLRKVLRVFADNGATVKELYQS